MADGGGRRAMVPIMRRIVEEPETAQLGQDVARIAAPAPAPHKQPSVSAIGEHQAMPAVQRAATAPMVPLAHRIAECRGDRGRGHDRAPVLGLIAPPADCRPAEIQASISRSSYKINPPTL